MISKSCYKSSKGPFDRKMNPEIIIVQCTFTGKIESFERSRRSSFWKCLFPWSDRLDKKRVLKFSKSWREPLFHATQFTGKDSFFSIFGREHSDLTATKQHTLNISGKKYEMRNDMTCNRLTRKTCSNDVYRKSFYVLLDHSERIFPKLLFYLANHLFQKLLGFCFVWHWVSSK